MRLALPLVIASVILAGCGSSLRGNSLGDLDEDDQLFLVAADGKDRTRLTDDDASHNDPAWSRDGTRLAFVTAGRGTSAIETIHPDGTDRRVILRRRTTGWDLTWSPNGRTFTLTTYDEDANLAKIHAVSTDGRRLETIASFVPPFIVPVGPSWSPDSTRLAYARGVGTGPPRIPRGAGPNAVAVIPGTFKIAVAPVMSPDELRVSKADGGEWDPRWAPTGERILFVRERGRRSALTVARRGGRSTVLAGGFIDLAADWSPDGRRVAVSGVLFRGDRNYHLWVIDARSRRMRKLADDVLPPRPSWSPDGSRIAIAAESGLAVVRVRDGVTQTLVRAGRAEISEVTWSPNGRWIAFTARRIPLD